MAQMFENEDKSNGSVQSLLKESSKYQRGQYAIQLSFYKDKVYLHLQCKQIHYIENRVDFLCTFFSTFFLQVISLSLLVDNNNGR